MEGIGIQEIFVLSTLLFFIGVYGFMTRKNMITILMSVELMLNAAAINFVMVNKFLYPQMLDGMFFTLFIIAIAAADVAIAIAIIINLYRLVSSVDVNQIEDMKH
jgi:NADH-quinone oxidoreductase subunit K